MEAADYAKKLIAAYRASGGGYVTVARLMTASGLTQAQAQAAFNVLAGAPGKANGWTVYTELPLSRGKVLKSPAGMRIGSILLVKHDRRTNEGKAS